MNGEQKCFRCGNVFYGDFTETHCYSCQGNRLSANRRAYREWQEENHAPNYPTQREEAEHTFTSSTDKPIRTYEPVPERPKTIQEILVEKYPDKKSVIITINTNKEIGGELDFSDYFDIKSLDVGDNNLTSVDFLNTIPNPEKLKYLRVANNNIKPTDISIFSKFVGLEQLKLGTSFFGSKRNKFCGSLRAFRNLNKLKWICVEATDIYGGLEYLPMNLVSLTRRESKIPSSDGPSFVHYIFECSPREHNAKIKIIQDKLRPYNYDIEAWQLSHPHKMYNSRPEYFTQEKSRDKWLRALRDKTTETQNKLKETQEQEPQATKRINRLKTKLQLLQTIQDNISTHSLLEKFQQKELIKKEDKETQTEEAIQIPIK